MSANLGMQSLGQITVAAAGTPVNALAQAQAASRDTGEDPDQTTGLVVPCYSVTIEAWPTNTGRIWVGINANLDISNGHYAMAWLGTGGVTTIALPRGAAQMGPGLINLASIWIDAEVNGESALVSYIRA